MDKKVPVITTLDELIHELHRVFESDNVNIEYVHDIMTSYKSNSKEWIKYAKFDRHRYTRNLVDAGNGKFNLMILAWAEGQGSSIHDHSDSHCFMKILDGKLLESKFQWPQDSENSEMVCSGETELKLNEVAYINDSIGLHRVENPSHSEVAVSLHLYCPPFDKCQMFDPRTGHKTQCTVTFWSKYGERTPFELTKSNNVINNQLEVCENN
ncbi:cysteine dioxygenase type 1-like [Centruroides sculpturatus]|uniref:cysteine dioxygenase type 1-like n=1 Tax=Centruroides sculpturatus TaxID=218467 RepID=UPI000C6E8112|nr:cysteine dioxygenase type 1-like [Centruroides sculpturatus]